MINSFTSKKLENLWVSGDVTLLPNTYRQEVIDILNLMDAAVEITDIELLGGFQIIEYAENTWAITITVNSVEQIGSVTCLFTDGNAYQVDLNEYS